MPGWPSSRSQPKHGILEQYTLDYALPWVDPRDIGDIAAARLLSTGWSGRQVQAVHGPEDLTLAQAAEIISEANGYRVRAKTISQETLRSFSAHLNAGGLGQGPGAGSQQGVTCRCPGLLSRPAGAGHLDRQGEDLPCARPRG